MLLLTLAAGIAASSAMPAIAAVSGDAPGHQRPATSAQSRRPGDDAQNPDERAARGERAEGDDEDAAPAGATLLLTPSTVVTAPGSRIRLTLSILGADDLRRFPVTVRFDPAVVGVASVRLGSAWHTRQQPVLLHDESRPGELIVGLGQLARDQAGISGSAELLELELIALAPGEAIVTLERFAAIGAGSKAQRTAALTASIVVR
jgi:hypothetical protein